MQTGSTGIESGICFGTLDGYCAAISHRHHHEGLSDPTADVVVRRVRRGLRRIMGTAPRRQAHPLTVDELDKLVSDRVRALDAWLKARPAGPGALFTRVYRSGFVATERIGPRAVSRLVQARAVAAGSDGIPVAGHSLRAGHVTTAAVNGASIDRIAAGTRHRDLGTFFNHFIRPAEVLATTTSRDLGV